MKLKELIYIYCVSCLLFISCSEQSVSGELGNRPKEQSFTVVVESVGELFTGGEGVVVQQALTRRPISSVTPTQTFDKLALLIVEYNSPAKIVYKKVIEDWSNPNNKASIPWTTED